MTYICYAKKCRINTEAILEATNPICNNRPPIQLFGLIFFFLSIDFHYLKVTVTGSVKLSNKNLLEKKCFLAMEE